MNYAKLMNIRKAYFGYEEIARTLGIAPRSARVCATRYVKQGLLVRIKRNIYVLREKWAALTIEEKFTLANLIQVPSYISLMTALSYYELTTQIQRDFIESVALKRTKQVEVGKTLFNFTKVDKKLYHGFSREKGFFIASPEKAFLDAVYLMSIKRYNLDTSSIDFSKFDPSKIKALVRLFPEKTKKFMETHGYLTKA